MRYLCFKAKRAITCDGALIGLDKCPANYNGDTYSWAKNELARAEPARASSKKLEPESAGSNKGSFLELKIHL